MEHNEGEIGIPMSAVSYGHMAAAAEVNSKLNNSGLQVGGGVVENGGEEAVIRSGSHERRNMSIKYRECLKNHAASIGGHANDGCGEFMPSGEDGTLEALKCAACGCHRNFHRRDTDPASNSSSCYYCYGTNGGALSKRPALQLPGVGPHMPLALPASPHGGAIARSSHPQMIVAFGGEEHDHMGGSLGGQAMYLPNAMRKRFRTKFTQEQKDKMCAFAEKVGWRIQKHDDLAVQQFCIEVGVKRHVLKVWMHNNKHTLAKKP